MPDPTSIQPLGYFRPAPPRRFPEDADARRWRHRRVAYRGCLGGVFAIIALYAGPNWINFGKLTGLTPADFVPIVQKACVPTVRAMKQYQRDHGSLPNRIEDLTPAYLPALPELAIEMQSVQNGRYWHLTRWNEQIEYDFTPGHEGWRVSGPFVTGKIPLPPVTAN